MTVDDYLRRSRVLLLESRGYLVDSVTSDDDAMHLLETQSVDLILLGRDSQLFETGLDQRIRQNYPKQLNLRVQHPSDALSIFASRTVDTVPQEVIDALNEMLDGNNDAH